MSLNFCNEPGCVDFAQSDDPTAPNLLLYKCEKHAEAARARGETGERRDWKATVLFENFAGAVAALPPEKPAKAKAPPPEPPPEASAPIEEPEARAEPEHSPEPGKAVPSRLRYGRTVEETDAAGNVIGTWVSAAAAEKAIGCPRSALAQSINKLGRWRGRFFRWQPGTEPRRKRLPEEIADPEEPPTPAAAETPVDTRKEPDMAQGNRNLHRRRAVEEIKDGVVVNSWPSVTAAEEAIGAGTGVLGYAIKRRGGTWKDRQFRYAGGPLPSPAAKPPRPARGLPDRNKLVDVEVVPAADQLQPTEHGSPIFGVLAGIAGMAIGTREMVLSDIELEHKTGATTLTVKIKQVSIRAAASSALAR